MDPICKPHVPGAEMLLELNGRGFTLDHAGVALAHTKRGRSLENVAELLSE